MCLSALAASEHPALRYFVRRDLLAAEDGPASARWSDRCALRILSRQQPDGRWRYSGGEPAIRSASGYDQLETYRQLGVLVCKFAFTRHHPAIERAVSYLASFQTEAGDYRGIYGSQYTPNYSAAITELLIRAGYARSRQVAATMRWLEAMRQEDGGWAIPTRTRGMPLASMLTAPGLVEPDRSRPSAHLVTGIVLRAYAAHPAHRHSAPARRAGEVLKSRFFLRDRYPDHVSASYWQIFSYPFWWTDLLSALDSLTRIGFAADDPDVARGLDWFIEHQHPGGLWNPGRNRPKDRFSDAWVALAVCRMLSRVGADPSSPPEGREDRDR